MTEVEELREEFKALQFMFSGHARLVCRALARGVLPSVAKMMTGEQLMEAETEQAQAGNDDLDLVADWSRQMGGEPITIEGSYDRVDSGSEHHVQ